MSARPERRLRALPDPLRDVGHPHLREHVLVVVDGHVVGAESTVTPLATSRRTGAIPHARRRLDEQLCATIAAARP